MQFDLALADLIRPYLLKGESTAWHAALSVIYVESYEAAASDDGTGGGESNVDAWRRAEDGVQGDVVIRSRYPYMALTVWSSEGFGMPSWRGDFARWSRYFTHGAGYVQGDAAVRHPSGAFR